MPDFFTLCRNNFSAGELSPLMQAAVDKPFYPQGCQILENMIPQRGGSVRRRPGTYYAGAAAGGTTASRLIRWKTSDGSNWVLELSNLYASVWNVSTHTKISGVATPYAQADLFNLSFCDVKSSLSDVSGTSGHGLWIAHQSYPPAYFQFDGTTLHYVVPTPNTTFPYGGYTPTPASPYTTFVSGDANANAWNNFSGAGNYPAVVSFIGGRLTFFSTKNNGNLMLMSRSPDYINGNDRLFDLTTLASGASAQSPDNAIANFYSALAPTPVRWVVSHLRMIVGTDRNMWADNGQACSAGVFGIQTAGFSGASSVPGKGIENYVVFVGHSGRTLSKMYYHFMYGFYIDEELTKMSDHILNSGVVEMDIQTYPFPIVWLVRADGVLVSCTLDLQGELQGEGKVVGWARHPMSGNVAAVCCPQTNAAAAGVNTPSSAGNDEVWLCVNRGTALAPAFDIEYMIFHDLQNVALSDLHYVDCGSYFSALNGPTPTVAQLANQTVDAVGDGAVLPRVTLNSSGQYTYNRSIKQLHIGLPMPSVLCPTRPDVPGRQTGSTQGKTKRITRAVVRVYNSTLGKIGRTLNPSGAGSLQRVIIPFVGGVPGSNAYEAIALSGGIPASGTQYPITFPYQAVSDIVVTISKQDSTDPEFNHVYTLIPGTDYFVTNPSIKGTLTVMANVSTWAASLGYTPDTLNIYYRPTLAGMADPLVSGDFELDLGGYTDTDGNIYIVQDDPMPLNVVAIMTRIALEEP
jgi:hypothetical protein